MSKYSEAEKLLANTIGLDPAVMGERAIKSEVDSLMQELGSDDLTHCLQELSLSEEKMGRFIERIVVPETWFFRDRECFRFLKRYAREAAAGKGSGPLRVLSSPCSTGEEPYSIAMTLCEAGLKPEDILVDGVDISKKALKAAREAEYGRASFRGETGYYEDKYFVVAGDRLRVNPHIASLVHFHYANILEKGFFADREPYHIVFCKNLLIYLNTEARRTLFAHLNRLLAPGGMLFTGHSELASFLQGGFEAAAHSRSFACTRSGPVSHFDRAPLPPVRKGRKKPLVRPPEIPVMAGPKTSGPLRGEIREDRRQRPPVPSLDTVRALADRGSLAEARTLCDRYLKEKGPDKEGYCLMGLISHAQNRPEEAEGFFLKTLYLDPLHYEALLHMSLLCDRGGDRSKGEIFRQRMRRLEEADRKGRKES